MCSPHSEHISLRTVHTAGAPWLPVPGSLRHGQHSSGVGLLGLSVCCVCCVPGPVLDTLPLLRHLSLKAVLCGQYQMRFTNEKQAQRGQATYPRSRSEVELAFGPADLRAFPSPVLFPLHREQRAWHTARM